MSDASEPCKDEESTLGGRINSDLPFEEAVKKLLGTGPGDAVQDTEDG